MNGLNGANPDFQKQQQQYLRMRGAQIAEQNAGQKTELGSTKARGSRKQLVGTIIGVAAAFAVLILLVALDVI